MKFSKKKMQKRVNGYKCHENQRLWDLKNAPSEEKVIKVQLYPSSMVAGGFHVPWLQPKISLFHWKSKASEIIVVKGGN